MLWKVISLVIDLNCTHHGPGMQKYTLKKKLNFTWPQAPISIQYRKITKVFPLKYVFWLKAFPLGNCSDIAGIELFPSITSGYRCRNLSQIEKALGNSKLVNMWWLLHPTGKIRWARFLPNATHKISLNWTNKTKKLFVI